ncbi:signal peptidase I [Candidatus Dojkabacteria bacterium]|nr:signal peptidase I [Candidatus Dojkabacteria bacterium]
MFMVYVVVMLVVMVIMIAAMWKIFAKAGKPGWAAIVPIYNMIVLLEIVGKPAWWVVLMFVPVVNAVMMILVSIELAKVFGKGSGFGIGLAFASIIFFPMLGFGKGQYKGAVAVSTQPVAPVSNVQPSPTV